MAIIKKFRIKSFKNINSVIEFENISIAYGNRLILDNINFKINEGQIFGMLGPNGVGKSTIFNLITGLVKPRNGKIKIQGQDVTNYPIYLRTKKFKVGYVPQYGGFFGDLTLIENLKAISEIVIENKNLRNERINYLISKFELENLKEIKAKFLSGGQVPVPVPGPDGATTIEYKDYGISLDIEPKAGVTGNITAKVRTEVSSLDQAVAFNNTPGFRNRSAETEVNLRDGETLVISGLVNRDLGNDLSQLKFLGDIPILGELFKSTNFRNKRSDLVIFITPYIFDANSEENKNQLKKAAELRDEFLKTIDKDSEILD